MARKRMIDPDFWTDEKVGTLKRDERLLFMGLISNADDEGRGRANSKLLKSSIFPYDDDIKAKDVDVMMQNIAGLNLAIIYKADGQDFYCLPNFLKHQNINRSTASRLPAPTDKNKNDLQLTEDSLRTHSQLTEDSLLKEVNIKEVKRSKDKGSLIEIVKQFTDNSKLIETITDYLQMRKVKRKPATTKALELVLKTLEPFPDDIRIAMLENSIKNSWTDVYEIRDNQPPAGQARKPIQTTNHQARTDIDYESLYTDVTKFKRRVEI